MKGISRFSSYLSGPSREFRHLDKSMPSLVKFRPLLVALLVLFCCTTSAEIEGGQRHFPDHLPLAKNRDRFVSVERGKVLAVSDQPNDFAESGAKKVPGTLACEERQLRGVLVL